VNEIGVNLQHYVLFLFNYQSSLGVIYYWFADC
jgi:hypothetical protein